MLLPHAISLALLAAGPGVRLASPGLSSIRIDQALTTFYSDHLAEQVAARGINVLTGNEITALLGLDRQRQLLACTEASCVTEIANALGVDGIITGSIGRFDDTFQINIKVIGARDGRPLSVFTVSVDGEKKALAALTDAAKHIASDVRGALQGGPVAATDVTDVPGSRFVVHDWWWVPGVAGVAAAGVGAVFLGIAASDSNTLTQRNPFPSYEQAASAHANGPTAQTLGIVLVAVGAAAVGGAVAWWGLTDAAPRATVGVGPGAASVVVRGVFP